MKDHHDLTKLKNAYIQKCKELETALSEYKAFAEDAAAKERVYLIAKSQSILRLKQAGQPVTLIPALAKGEAASHRFDYHVADAVFSACKENIKRLHANLDAYRSLLSVAKSEMEVR
jgi:hypothetical protein